jgi:hypothetical protein
VKPILLGCGLLFGGHAVAVLVSWFVTRDVPLNVHVAVLAMLGLVQLVYAVPLAGVLLFKRRGAIALGVVLGAALTGAVSRFALSL